MLEAMQGNNAMAAGPNVQDLAYLGAGLRGQGRIKGWPRTPLLPLLVHGLAAPALTPVLSSHLFSWPPIVAKGLTEVNIWPGPCPLAHIEDGMDKCLKAFSQGQ